MVRIKCNLTGLIKIGSQQDMRYIGLSQWIDESHYSKPMLASVFHIAISNIITS